MKKISRGGLSEQMKKPFPRLLQLAIIVFIVLILGIAIKENQQNLAYEARQSAGAIVAPTVPLYGALDRVELVQLTESSDVSLSISRLSHAGLEDLGTFEGVLGQQDILPAELKPSLYRYKVPAAPSEFVVLVPNSNSPTSDKLIENKAKTGLLTYYVTFLSQK